MRFWVRTGSPLTVKEPVAPGDPPNSPAGGWASLLVTALSVHGRALSTVNSMTWPRPPGLVPAPAEPVRSS